MPTSRRSPLTCPRCGARMNHHAEKLVVTAAPDPGVDPDLGGYIEELHTVRTAVTWSRGASTRRPGD